MKMKLLTAFLVTWLISLPLYAGSFYLTEAGPQVCDDQVHETIWFNSTGNTVRFTSALTWIGIDYKGIGDAWVFVEKLSTGEPMTFLAWDHYANPTGLHQFHEQFNPTFNVAVGDGLRLISFCQLKNKNMQVIIKAMYE
jgi:hypothetical protein